MLGAGLARVNVAFALAPNDPHPLARSPVGRESGNSAVISMDSLFSVPNFYMSEKIFSIITQIKLFTQNNLIIQTRNSDENLIKLASEGNVGEFYRNEIENEAE